MALSEQYRQKLDTIVSKMESAGESDDEIRAVVADFKSKYQGAQENAQPAQGPSLGRMLAPQTAEYARTAREGLNVGREMRPGMPSSFADMAGPTDTRALTAPISDAATLGTRTLGAMIPSRFTRGENQSFSEAMADPETGLMRGAREASAETMKTGAARAMDPNRGFIDRAQGGLDAARGGAQYLASSLVEDPLTLASGGAALAKKIAPKVGAAPKAVGEAIQYKVIRPLNSEIRSGFDVKNVAKYGVGGSVDDVVTKTQAKIDQYSDALKRAIQEGKDGGKRINLTEAIDQVGAEIAKDKAGNAGIILEYRRALDRLKARAKAVADGGDVDLLEAQKFKQAVGDIASWDELASQYGRAISRNETVESQMARRIYGKLKAQIEDAAPEGVREYNKALSELLPIRSAAVKRKIVSDRNSVMSLNDMLGTIATIQTGAPGAALLTGNALSKSGKFSRVLTDLGTRLQKTQDPKEAQAIIKMMRNAGATDAAIKSFLQPQDSTNAD